MSAKFSKLLQSIPNVIHAFNSAEFVPNTDLLRCHQVHGDALLEVIDQTNSEEMKTIKADGLLTRVSKTVGIQTADCLPVLFADRAGSMVAAVHAGWRGLHQGILVRTVEKFFDAGFSPSQIVVAIGPAIGPCCFEVSRDVIEAFQKKWGYLWNKENNDKQNFLSPVSATQIKSSAPQRSQAPVSANNLWLNLDLIARLQLVEQGLSDNQIEDVGGCTYCGPSSFASHRRAIHENAKAERQWSVIGFRG